MSSTTESLADKVRGFWEERAEQHAANPAATTNDVHLRELEIVTFIETLKEVGFNSGDCLDVGCGDGYSTLRVAAALPGCRFHGVDYSDNMIANARAGLKDMPEIADRLNFSVGDALNLSDAVGDRTYDVVTSDRCLINLESFEAQASAIAQIASHVKPGGHYIGIENFMEGQNNLSAARAHMGLSEIPVRWHNLFFKKDEFLSECSKHFELVEWKDFSSSYYFATRVLYSAICKTEGSEPDYQHPIHQMAGKLPWTGEFSPICMAVLQRRT